MPSSPPLPLIVWITPPAAVFNVPPWMVPPLRSTCEPATSAWMVPPALSTAVFWITSPPVLDDCMTPVLIARLAPVLRVSEPGWLALTVPALVNVSEFAPSSPAPSIVLVRFTSWNAPLLPKIWLLALFVRWIAPVPFSVTIGLPIRRFVALAVAFRLIELLLMMVPSSVSD